MAEKEQINFRFPSALLKKIKEQAKEQGISHTQWIINACNKQMGETDANNSSSNSTSTSETTKKLEARVEELEKEIQQIRKGFYGLHCELEHDQQSQSPKPKPGKDVSEDGVSYRKLAEILGIDKSYLTKWQQGQVPNKQSKRKTKEAYEKWKQWCLSDDNLWYPRNN